MKAKLYVPLSDNSSPPRLKKIGLNAFRQSGLRCMGPNLYDKKLALIQKSEGRKKANRAGSIFRARAFTLA